MENQEKFMPINDRLKLFAEKNRYDKKSMSKIAGITSFTIEGIFKKRNEPSCMVLRACADGFPNLNMNWLFRGEGEMEVGEEVTDNNLIAKVAYLESLLAEKERTIQILMSNAKG